ncbi:MAG: nucleotidyltransferase family protein [Acidobacteriota bacterium]
MLPSLSSLLTLCARIDTDPESRERIARMSAAIDWDRLPDLAEVHGLAPLLYEHLEPMGTFVPRAARQRLLTYRIQHAHAARVRAAVLAEILALYRDLEIDVLLLKGAALAHLLYPRPDLRPMRDIDLLVRPVDAERAQAALADIGFTRPPSPMHGLDPAHHHLAGVTRHVDGIELGVEVHRRLKLRNDFRPTGRFDEFAPRAQACRVHGATARTLGPEDMLWHVYRHAFNAANREPLRLVWLADLVGIVERWLDRIDWDRVRRVYPALLRVLPVLDALTPLDDRVLERLDLERGDPWPEDGPLPVFQGWPRIPLRCRGPRSLSRFVQDSLFPPTRWLLLVYGHGPSRPGLCRAWLAHLGTLARAARRYTLEQAARLWKWSGKAIDLRAAGSSP